MSSSPRLSIVKWRRLSRWPFSKEENVDLSLLVAILDGDGPDSRWLSSNRKLLSATAQGLSLGGCPIVKSWKDQIPLHLFCYYALSQMDEET
ncbi:hypothetical protein F2Q69_00027181 [Brassica cretica]|uniref:Uncharacterized protein n=1 Tax=Brassica cretica TaxID=69181 RepID=A0A8S9S6E5_BRACR|nr:hypothetical protein F2Q69_00027181 [Brassica cretica]